MRRTKHSIDHPASAPIQSDKQSAKVFIPYYPHVNKQISSILHRHSVSSACTSNKNLRDLHSSTKSRQPALQTSNVIYQIPCKDCSATYCGQTSRPLHKRITEHEHYTRPAYSHATDLQQSSALAQDAQASGHQIDFSSAVILAKLQHQQHLDLVEHAAITVLEPSLNRNHAAPSINPQWHTILQSISEQFPPISITWSISPFTLVTPCLFSCISLHLTCIYHCTYVSYHLTSTHHSPSHISYFQYLSVCFIFISLADDGCNTAIESFQSFSIESLPSILKNIPASIQRRLNSISSSEDMFGGAKDEYDKALKDAGYKGALQYDSEVTRGCRPKRKRSRRIIWFNPPYSKSVATNIGKEFFKLLRVHFPKQHPLHRIFNDNTVKLSYSCMPNMDSVVKADNSKILRKVENLQTTDQRSCNCRDKAKCPVGNNCLQANVVYKATVQHESKTSTYIGMTEYIQNSLYTSQVVPET